MIKTQKTFQTANAKLFGMSAGKEIAPARSPFSTVSKVNLNNMAFFFRIIF